MAGEESALFLATRKADLRRDGFVKDLLHLLRKKEKAPELLSWSIGYCESSVAQQTNWRTGALLARKIRQFVKHRWDAQRQAPGSASAMLAQHRARRFFASRAASPNQILGIWPQ